MDINKKVLKVIYNDYKDLEKRVKKFNQENKSKMTAREALDKFDTNYTEGIEANVKIHKIRAFGEYKLKYVLFYDYDTLKVDFSDGTAKIESKIFAYADEYTNKSEKFNIEELEEIIRKDFKKIEDEIQFEDEEEM